MTQKEQPSIGDVFEVRYPFSRETFDKFGEGEELRWKPGPRYEMTLVRGWSGEPTEETRCVVDAHGAQVLTVVGVYKPSVGPLRVFVRRQWRDPDGAVFGKKRILIWSLAKFRRVLSGYRYADTPEMQRQRSEEAARDFDRAMRKAVSHD